MTTHQKTHSTSFAPGPYGYALEGDDEDDLWAIVGAPDGMVIAHVFADFHEDMRPRGEANARLLAAAPGLFDALVLLLDALPSVGTPASPGIAAARLQAVDAVRSVLGKCVS